MDKALELKIKYEQNKIGSAAEVESHLSSSNLFKDLLADFEENTLNLLWRLTQLSEIPFSGDNAKVAEWTKALVDKTNTGEGFSLDGTNDYLLACYNGMITSLLIKLKYPNKERINAGLNWILKYQNVKRGEKCNWEGAALKKYGGCMKNTPCYIGLVKSMIALSDYKQSEYYKKNDALEQKLNDGLRYILNQKIFLRLTDNKPITSEIIKLTYPFTWKTNIIEILRLLKANNLISDQRCTEALSYLKSKQKKDGGWWAQTSHIQKNKAWVPFDKSREKGRWISYEIEKLIL